MWLPPGGLLLNRTNNLKRSMQGIWVVAFLLSLMGTQLIVAEHRPTSLSERVPQSKPTCTLLRAKHTTSNWEQNSCTGT